MAVLALLAAVTLAAIFVWAAVAKLRAPARTSDSFRALHLPVPLLLSRVVPIVELVVAVLLLAVPALGAPMAFVLLVIFSAFLGVQLLGGNTAPCACFGQVTASPLSSRELWRNLALACLAIIAWWGS